MKKDGFFSKILVGLSIGIVVALIPGALLGELMKLVAKHYAFANNVIVITKISTSLLSIAIGVCIGMQFQFNPIQTASLGISCLVGSGVVKIVNNALVLKGTGDVINTAITAIIAAFLIIKLGNSLKAYTILLIPLIVIVLAGGIGLITLPYVSKITALLGQGILYITKIEPYIMGILIAVIFSFLIVSPFSTVGIALAIKMAGIASGAANLGIVAAGFGLAIAGWRVNTFGTSIAHFLGSPKMQMANFVKKPIMMLPIALNAAILGLCAAIFNIQGTSYSAGFGISGLIGPLNAYNTGSNILTILLVFVILPIVLGLIFSYIFTKIIKINKEEDYKLEF